MELHTPVRELGASFVQSAVPPSRPSRDPEAQRKVSEAVQTALITALATLAASNDPRWEDPGALGHEVVFNELAYRRQLLYYYIASRKRRRVQAARSFSA